MYSPPLRPIVLTKLTAGIWTDDSAPIVSPRLWGFHGSPAKAQGRTGSAVCWIRGAKCQLAETESLETLVVLLRRLCSILLAKSASRLWMVVNVQARWTDIHRVSESTGPDTRPVCLLGMYLKTMAKPPPETLSYLLHLSTRPFRRLLCAARGP